MEDNQGISILQSIFSSPPSNQSKLIGNRIVNDVAINDLLVYLSSNTSQTENKVIIDELIKNFNLVRMNVVRFVKSSHSDLFRTLFNLYLSDEDSPSNSVLQFLEILLKEATLETNTFSWLFEGIKEKMKHDSIMTFAYLKNYLTLLKYFYNSNTNQDKEEEEDDDEEEVQKKQNEKEDDQFPLSYFYFYPSQNPIHEILSLVSKPNNNQNELDFANGIGVSIWLKFPFKDNNIQNLLEEELPTKTFNLIEIMLDNEEKIKCAIEIKAEQIENATITVLYKNSKVCQLYPFNDKPIHLFLLVSLKESSCKLLINDKSILLPFFNIGSSKLKSVSLFKEWFGEVSSVVIYSCHNIIELEPVSFQEEKLKSFTLYANCFNNPEASISNVALAYFPETKGENSWNDLENNSRHSFLFHNNNSSYYTYCNIKDIINRNFGIDCLLPIFEYIYSQRNNSIFSSHLNELVLCFLKIIPLNLKSQFYSVSMDNFHRILCLFIEKMPDEIFTEQLFEFITFPFYYTNKKSDKLSNYFNAFVLNENLMRRFSYSFDFWKFITSLLGGAFSDILDYISIQQMIKFILYLDKDRYTEYCCIEHRDAFLPKQKCSMKVMSPQLNDRINCLSKLIITKIKADTKTSSYIYNKESKEQKKDAESSILALSKMFHLSNSPCLTIKLLQIMKHFISSFDNAIFTNCCYALNSPCLDVKNAAIDLIIHCIENCELSQLSNFKETNIGELITEYSDKKDLSSMFTQEYNKLSISNTYNIFLKWLLPLDNERRFSNPKANENRNSTDKQAETKDNDNSQKQPQNQIISNNDTFDVTKSEFDNVKQLILFIINKLKEDSTICQSFFKEAFDMIIVQLDNLTIDELNKLRSMMQKGLLDRKFFSMQKKKKGINSATILYLKSIKMYYYQCINPSEIKQIIPKISRIVTQLIQIDSFNSEKKDQARVINERLLKKTLFILQKNDSIAPNITESRYLLIDFISIAISYNCCLSINKSDNLFFDMLTCENASWNKMFDKILEHYSLIWESKEYSMNKTLKDIISKSNEKIPIVMELFTRVKSGLHFNLSIILSLIYSNLIKNAVGSNKVIDLIIKYSHFIYFIFILGVYPQKEINTLDPMKKRKSKIIFTDQDQKVFFETIMIGLNCLFPLSDQYSDARKGILKLLYSILVFFDIKKYQKQKCKLIETVASASAFKGCEKYLLTSFLSLFVESANSALFLTVFEKIIKSKENQIEDVFQKTELIKEFCAIIDKSYKSINEEHQNEFFNQIITAKVEHKPASTGSKIKNATIDEFVELMVIDLNGDEIKEMKRRKRYKQIKKALCSWNKPWSDKELFYSPSPELNSKTDLNAHNAFKTKFLNHYTMSFTRPFLVPIINIFDYLPEFEKFDTTKDLFNPNDIHTLDHVTTSLDVDIKEAVAAAVEFRTDSGKALATSEQMSKKDRESNEDSTKDYEKKDKNTLFDYFEKKDQYYKYQLLAMNNDFNLKFNIKVCEKLNLIRSEKNNYDTCCIVKASRHIKGILTLDTVQLRIVFKPFLPRSIARSKHEMNDITYDQYKDTCFGSYCNNYPKDYFRKQYLFKISQITHLIERKYYYRDSSIEIFFMNHKSYLFNFLSEQKKTEIFNLLRELLKDKPVTVLEYKQMKSAFLTNAKDDWRKWNLSNFHFLMLLNLCSNRSFYDISQYPIVPWIVSEFNKDQLTFCDSDFRDLSLPVGMLEFESKPKSTERKNEYIDNFHSLQLDESTDKLFDPYYFGSHYSNPIYVAHFLTRIFPLLEVAIEIQGNKFDNPNRLFFSIASAFDGATTQKGDVRELIPELFYLPEMLVNINNFKLGIKRDGERVDNVDCPQWAKSNPFEFISLMRRSIESSYVSEHLNTWVDLVFGSKQRGHAAKEANNLFMSTSYCENIVINDKTTQTERENLYRLVEFGLIPKQLFTNPLEARKTYQMMTKKYANQKGEDCIIIKTLNSSNQSPLYMKVINSNEIFLYQSNGIIEAIKFNKSNKVYEKTDQALYGIKLLSNASFAKKCGICANKIAEYYETNNIPLLIYNKGNCIAQGGFHDGSILLTHGTSTVTRTLKYNLNKKIDRSPICVFAILKEDYIVFGGAENGTIAMYTHSKCQLKHCKSIHFHHDRILDISVSRELNAFVSSSRDNYVHLITLPTLKLIRSMYIEQCDRVFLSDSPLPSILVHSSKHDAFFCYSLNGFLIKTIQFNTQEEGTMITSKLIKDSFYCDYLIYLTSKNILLIKSLPNLEKVAQYPLGSCSFKSYFDVDEENHNLVVYTENVQELKYIKDYFKVI